MQGNAKQYPEVELLQNNRTYSKKEKVCPYSWDYMINHSENNDENEK